MSYRIIGHTHIKPKDKADSKILKRTRLYSNKWEGVFYRSDDLEHAKAELPLLQEKHPLVTFELQDWGPVSIEMDMWRKVEKEPTQAFGFVVEKEKSEGGE